MASHFLPETESTGRAGRSGAALDVDSLNVFITLASSFFYMLLSLRGVLKEGEDSEAVDSCEYLHCLGKSIFN